MSRNGGIGIREREVTASALGFCIARGKEFWTDISGYIKGSIRSVLQ
jgi:hypothetical protein